MRFLDFDGYWDDWVRAQQVAIAAATRLGDVNALARMHLSASYACRRLGEDQQAGTHARGALELFERLGWTTDAERVRAKISEGTPGTQP